MLLFTCMSAHPISHPPARHSLVLRCVVVLQKVQRVLVLVLVELLLVLLVHRQVNRHASLSSIAHLLLLLLARPAAYTQVCEQARHPGQRRQVHVVVGQDGRASCWQRCSLTLGRRRHVPSDVYRRQAREGVGRQGRPRRYSLQARLLDGV